MTRSRSVDPDHSNHTDEARCIGLIGGMSWPSTLTYYREINERVGRILGGSHSARLVICSDDYAEIERMQLHDEWEAAGSRLAHSARRLEAAGADLVGIACNTMHRVAAEVREATDLPLVDLVESAADAALARNVKSAVVLGTRFTAAMPSYAQALRSRGMTSQPVPADVQRALDRMIYDELCLGSVTEESRRLLTEIISSAVAAGADGVLLACTELGLLVSASDLDEAVLIDTAEVHIDALVSASLGRRSVAG
ncbi:MULTISPECIES: aspartate/glutamate racemase family protein [Streptomyces]|uniref:Aspartate racemase n=1 Tax=Streptomyces albus (strain ATCC 21838 / DSM 41398 / FERM P-419 / JCM 4703 / NBRC 107858) TaxID=1081613 RepID=A0A0B5ENL9_STRA4|nr:amino acid racemase [Streptomyces sp. SCSIO ZS0520]AJE80900.1 aspartate racemase [Streptomyces albus]AOU75214.1 aspartate racemase [Streptomyces albus]